MPEVKFIREVWAENLEEEMSHLRDLVEEYPYLAMVRCSQPICLFVATAETCHLPIGNTRNVL